LEAVFNEPQIGKANYAGQDVASHLAVRPMAHGHDTHEIVVFGLAKSVLHPVAVKACPDDFIGGPVQVVSDDDVFAEPLDVLADSIVVVAKQKAPLLFVLFDRKLVEVFGLKRLEPGMNLFRGGLLTLMT
jgi:hypothetical protein